VPVPVVELKTHYTGYFIDPLRGFFSRHRAAEHEATSKSIVRPAFSMYGKMRIADSALVDIVRLTVADIWEIKTISNIVVKVDGERTRSITINVDAVLFYGVVIREVMRLTQHRIKQRVEEMTAMNVAAVNIFVRRLFPR